MVLVEAREATSIDTYMTCRGGFLKIKIYAYNMNESRYMYEKKKLICDFLSFLFTQSSV